MFSCDDSLARRDAGVATTFARARVTTVAEMIFRNGYGNASFNNQYATIRKRPLLG